MGAWSTGRNFCVIVYCVSQWIFAAEVPGRITAPVCELGEFTVLREWAILGPFAGADNRRSWQSDYLSKLGAEESSCTKEQFEKAGRMVLERQRGVDPEENLSFVRVETPLVTDLNYVFRRPNGAELSSAAYMGAVVRARTSSQVYLMLGRAGSLVVWCNGARVYSDDSMDVLRTYSHCVTINLRAGDNWLLMKVGRQSYGDWGAAAAVATTSENATAAALRYQRSTRTVMLVSDIVPSSDDLALGIPGSLAAGTLSGRICDLHGNYIREAVFDASGRITADQSGTVLPSGLYRLELRVGDDKYSQLFLVGAADDALQHRRAVARDLQPNSPKAEPIIASLLTTLEGLVALPVSREVNAPDKVADWRHRIVHFLAEFDDTVESAQAGRPLAETSFGFATRSFVSEIDGSRQYYRVYMPKGGKAGRALPVTIMVTPELSKSVPFLQSSIYSSADSLESAEALAAIADRHGMAIIWPGYRTLPKGFPCEFTHLDEVIKDFTGDVLIDNNRIYLTGACGSGMVASMAILRWPHRFAAAGFLHPLFRRIGNGERAEEWMQFKDFNGYVGWCKKNNPVPLIYGVKDVPYYVIYDGALPKHGNIYAAEQFAQEGQRAGMDVKFEWRPQAARGEAGGFEAILEWFAGKSRASNSAERAATYFVEDPKLGSAAEVVAQRCAIARGKSRDTFEKDEVDRAAAAFARKWREVQFSEIRTVAAADVNQAIESTTNLILFGSSETNEVWKRVASNVGILVSPEFIEIDGRRWLGNDIVFVAVVRHPLYLGRRLLLVGGNMRDARELDIDVVSNGWYNCAVWRRVSGRMELIFADNMDVRALPQ